MKRLKQNKESKTTECSLYSPPTIVYTVDEYSTIKKALRYFKKYGNGGNQAIQLFYPESNPVEWNQQFGFFEWFSEDNQRWWISPTYYIKLIEKSLGKEDNESIKKKSVKKHREPKTENKNEKAIK
jgi:hypothetical protein